MKGIMLVVAVLSVLFVSGCVSQTQETSGTGAEMLKFGASLPLTGDLSNFGLAMQNSINLAVEEINSNGGINGKMLEIVYEDDVCDGAKSVTTVTKLVHVDKVSAVIGPFCSSALL